MSSRHPFAASVQPTDEETAIADRILASGPPEPDAESFKNLRVVLQGYGLSEQELDDAVLAAEADATLDPQNRCRGQTTQAAGGDDPRNASALPTDDAERVRAILSA